MRPLFAAALFALLGSVASAQPVAWSHGAGLPVTCEPVTVYVKTDATPALYICALANTWTKLDQGGEGPSGEGGGVPADGIILIKSGTCPTGFEEDTDLAGKTIIGTTAAAGDVGTTGGSDTITDVINHTHAVTVTDPGHGHTLPAFAHATGSSANKVEVTNSSTGSSASANSNTTGITAATQNPAGGAASIDNRSAFIRVIPCRKT